jgi:hypothetical protein
VSGASAAGPIAVLVLLAIFLWLVPAVLAYQVGEKKRRLGLVWWGVCLGWIGLAIAAMVGDGIGPDAQRCPHCKSLVPGDATRCRHCAGELRSPLHGAG